MTYLELDVVNDTTITGILKFVNLDTPSFWPLILFAMFVVITLSTFFSEKERKGTGNALSSLAVAGFVNIVLSALLSTIGLISTINLIISVVISFIFIALYLLTGR